MLVNSTPNLKYVALKTRPRLAQTMSVCGELIDRNKKGTTTGECYGQTLPSIIQIQTSSFPKDAGLVLTHPTTNPKIYKYKSITLKSY